VSACPDCNNTGACTAGWTNTSCGFNCTKMVQTNCTSYPSCNKT
jgi:hypothetical protein